MTYACRIGNAALIERYVEGLTVETVVVQDDGGISALSPAAFLNPEVSPFSFEARYSADLITITLPAPIPAEGCVAPQSRSQPWSLRNQPTHDAR